MQKSWQGALDKGKIYDIITLATDESAPTDVRKYDAFPALKFFNGRMKNYESEVT
jgi:hypothetical protein